MNFEWDERKNRAMNEESMKQPLESDWVRVDAMTDEDIDTSDIPPLSDGFFRGARIRMPKERVTVNVDADLLQWFQSQGQDYERRMNAALRLYVEAHRAA